MFAVLSVFPRFFSDICETKAAPLVASECDKLSLCPGAWCGTYHSLTAAHSVHKQIGGSAVGQHQLVREAQCSFSTSALWGLWTYGDLLSIYTLVSLALCPHDQSVLSGSPCLCCFFREIELHLFAPSAPIKFSYLAFFFVAFTVFLVSFCDGFLCNFKQRQHQIVILDFG